MDQNEWRPKVIVHRFNVDRRSRRHRLEETLRYFHDEGRGLFIELSHLLDALSASVRPPVHLLSTASPVPKHSVRDLIPASSSSPHALTAAASPLLAVAAAHVEA